MAFDAIYTANTVLHRAKRHNISDMTPMKLQKLLFLAHSIYLKRYNEPLIDEPFFKWAYGPVNKSVYREFNSFGDRPITEYATDAKGQAFVIQDNEAQPIWAIDEALSKYGHLHAYHLSDLTHSKDSAWRKTRDNCEIYNKTILESPIP